MATKTVINVSPKVLTGLLTGLGTAALLGTAQSVDTHTFDFLGDWGPVAKLAFTVLVSQGAAWLKREHDAAETPATPAAGSSYVRAWVGGDGAIGVAPATTEPLVPQTADQIIAGPTA